MKKILLTLEAVIVILPISLFVAYMTLLQFIFGVPLHLINEGFDSNIFMALLGNIAGIIALLKLIELSVKTVNGKAYRFNKVFFFSLFCGVIASAALFIIYEPLISLCLILPIVLVTIHFVYLQTKSSWCLNE